MIFMQENPTIWEDIYSKAHMVLVPKEEAERDNLLSYPTHTNFVLVPEIVTTDENGEYIAAPLTNEDADMYKLHYSKSRIQRAATFNTTMLCPPLLCTHIDYLLNQSDINNFLSDESAQDAKQSDFLLLTNTRKFHGASVLFEDGIVDKIHKILNEGFMALVADKDCCYILPETLIREHMANINKDMSMLDEVIAGHPELLWFPKNSTLYDDKLCYIYTLTDKEITDHPFINEKGEAAFYRFVVEHFCHHNYDEITSCDCTKIDIAQNIQDSWFNAEEKRITKEYFAQYGRNPDETTLKDGRTQFVMFLAMSGPKAMPDLPDNTIRFSEDFITI
jgi:hypothetical protein